MNGEPNGDRVKRALSWAVRLVLSVVLIAWLVSRPATRQALTQLNARTGQAVATAVLLYAGCQMLNAYKWFLLLRGTGRPLSYRATVRITFIGMFSNYFLPTSIGGDLVRVGLAMRAGVPGSTGALTVFLQRFTGLVALLVIGLLGVLAGAAAAEQRPERVLLVAAAVTVIGLAGMAVGAVAEQRWALGDRLPGFLGRPVRRLGEGLRQLASSPGTVASVMAVSVVYQLGMVGLQALLGIAAGVTPTPLHWLWIVPLMSLGEMVPVGLAGIGPREATAEYLLGQLGFAGQAVLASLMWQAMRILTSLPGGYLLLASGRREAEEAGQPAANQAAGDGGG